MSTRKLTIVLNVLLIGFFVVTPGWAGEGEDTSNGTTYEKHVGIFASNQKSATHEPLLGSGEKVTRPVFSLMDGADRFLGRTLHSKTYREGNNDSFVTLEQEGAKMGYDF